SYRNPTGNLSFHHNLFSTCRDRHPTLGSANEPPQYTIDFRNNVIYNWRAGPMSDISILPIAMKGSLADMAKGHMEGNVFEGRDDLTRDNYAALNFHRWLRPDSGYKYQGKLADWKSDNAPQLGTDCPETQAAHQAFELVLTKAGASLRRDAVDLRV